MAFFVGDGTEVLACETYRHNAEARLKELQSTTEDNLAIYELDPFETTFDDRGQVVLANPGEYAAYALEYDAPSALDICEKAATD